MGRQGIRESADSSPGLIKRAKRLVRGNPMAVKKRGRVAGTTNYRS